MHYKYSLWQILLHKQLKYIPSPQRKTVNVDSAGPFLTPLNALKLFPPPRLTSSPKMLWVCARVSLLRSKCGRRKMATNGFTDHYNAAILHYFTIHGYTMAPIFVFFRPSTLALGTTKNCLKTHQMFPSTEIFSKRRKIYSFEGKPEHVLIEQNLHYLRKLITCCSNGDSSAPTHATALRIIHSSLT